MKNVTGAVQVKNKKTGEITTAIYSANRLGNKQYNVNGKFLNDRIFDRLYEIVYEKEKI